MSPDELLRWRDYYARLVGREVDAERRTAGKGSRSKRKVRFTG